MKIILIARLRLSTAGIPCAARSPPGVTNTAAHLWINIYYDNLTVYKSVNYRFSCCGKLISLSCWLAATFSLQNTGLFWFVVKKFLQKTNNQWLKSHQVFLQQHVWLFLWCGCRVAAGAEQGTIWCLPVERTSLTLGSTEACWDCDSTCPGLKGIFGGRHTSNYLGRITKIHRDRAHKQTDAHIPYIQLVRGNSKILALLLLQHQSLQNSWILSACVDVWLQIWIWIAIWIVATPSFHLALLMHSARLLGSLHGPVWGAAGTCGAASMVSLLHFKTVLKSLFCVKYPH